MQISFSAFVFISVFVLTTEQKFSFMCPAPILCIMRQLLSAFFCFFLIGVNAQENNSANENASSRWLNKKIDVDGKIIEWDQNDLINDSKAGLSYIIANDTSVLYI